MGILNGKEWWQWDEISDIVNLASNRATVKYINLLDYADSNDSQFWKNAAHNLLEVKKQIDSHLGNDVPEGLSNSSIYREIDDSLSPFANDGEILAAIAGLHNPIPIYDYDGNLIGNSPPPTRKLSPGTKVAIVLGLGGLLGIGYFLVKRK